MKRVKVISAHCKGGGVDLLEGTILTVGVDITEKEAALKVKQGFVAELPEAPEEEAPEHPEAGEEIVDRDPKPSRGRKK